MCPSSSHTTTRGAPDATRPLYVDLDGTLIKTDMLWEGLARAIRYAPRQLLAALPQMRSRAAFKECIAKQGGTEPALLPYRNEVIQMIREARASGRRVVLATAADEREASVVADHCKLFDSVLASNGDRNLKGPTKLHAIRADCAGDFDYIGDSVADRPILTAAVRGTLVRNPDGEEARALRKLLLPPQLLGNLVVLVPSLLPGPADFPFASWAGLLAVVAFSLADVGSRSIAAFLNIHDDRVAGRENPLAAGSLHPRQAAVIALASIPAGAMIAGAVGGLALATILLAFAATLVGALLQPRRRWQRTLGAVALLGLRLLAGSLLASSLGIKAAV